MTDKPTRSVKFVDADFNSPPTGTDSSSMPFLRGVETLLWAHGTMIRLLKRTEVPHDYMHINRDY